jgi:hypothetical protein
MSNSERPFVVGYVLVGYMDMEKVLTVGVVVIVMIAAPDRTSQVWPGECITTDSYF